MNDQAQEAPDTTELDDAVPFPADIQAIIDAGLEKHRALPVAQAEVDKILAQRRALVLKARARGVSGYRLAQLYGVSQTTIGNWCQPRD